MKKMFFLSVLMMFLAQFSWSIISTETSESTTTSVTAADMYIDGSSSLILNGDMVGASYVLYNAPFGAVLKWSIIGEGRTYCYPNGSYCSINIYGPGSYRLLCDVYVNGVRVDGVTKYITVMP